MQDVADREGRDPVVEKAEKAGQGVDEVLARGIQARGGMERLPQQGDCYVRRLATQLVGVENDLGDRSGTVPEVQLLQDHPHPDRSRARAGENGDAKRLQADRRLTDPHAALEVKVHPQLGADGALGRAGQGGESAGVGLDEGRPDREAQRRLGRIGHVVARACHRRGGTDDHRPRPVSADDQEQVAAMPRIEEWVPALADRRTGGGSVRWQQALQGPQQGRPLWWAGEHLLQVAHRTVEPVDVDRAVLGDQADRLAGVDQLFGETRGVDHRGTCAVS